LDGALEGRLFWLDNLSIGSADVMTAKDCAALMMTSGQAKNHSRNLIQKH